MVFNIASAGLTWSSWLNNSTNTYVSYDSYCLSATELALVVLSLYYTFVQAMNNKVLFSIFLLVIQAYNIAYSSIAIQMYLDNTLVDSKFANMTLAVIILNSIGLCGCYGSHHVRDQDNSSVPQMRSNTLSRV